MKEQFNKRKSSRPEMSGQGFRKKSFDRPRSFDGPRSSDAPRPFRDSNEGGGDFGGGGGDERSERRSTFRREGAVGGWSPQFQRPRREGGFGGPRRFEGGNSGGPRRDFGGSSNRFPGSRDSGPRDSGPRDSAPRAPRAPAAVVAQPVAAQKLKEGLKAANRAIAELMDGFGKGIAGAYDISALEAVVSFDGEGRFMGFGQGGAAAFTLTLTPLDAQDVFEHGDEGEEGFVQTQEASEAAEGEVALADDAETFDASFDLDDEDEDEDTEMDGDEDEDEEEEDGLDDEASAEASKSTEDAKTPRPSKS